MRTTDSMKILFLVADSNGCYPVPASKDGAVTTLVERLVKLNESQKKLDIELISYFDEKAFSISRDKYPNTKFIWIKIPKVISVLDDIFYNFIKRFFKKKKLISYKKIFSLLWYVFKSSVYLKKSNYDKVILENNMVLSWVIKLAKYQGDFYYHLHNIPRTCVKNKKTFERCTGYLCVSNFVGKQIKDENNAIGPIEESKIKILYNCIDTSFFCIKENFDRRKVLSEFGISEDEKVILFVGRISEEKGILELLESTEYLKATNYKILIVGSYIHSDNKTNDKYSDAVSSYASKLDNRVVFTGYINQDKIVDIYNSADVAVLPSMWDEPAGLTMIEAMACGVKLITTRSGGIPEYVSNCAIVLERDDNLVKNIAINIDNILLDSNSFDDNNGVCRINKMFSEQYYLEKFISSLER